MSTELADSLEKLTKDASAKPANALQYAENLKNAEKVQTLAAQLQTRAAEYEKLPKNVQRSLEAKYGVQLQDSVRRAGEATVTK